MRLFAHLRTRRRRQLVAHTIDGRSIRGILIGDYADVIVLASPELLTSDGAAALGGEVILLRESISFLQDVSNVVAPPAPELPGAPRR